MPDDRDRQQRARLAAEALARAKADARARGHRPAWRDESGAGTRGAAPAGAAGDPSAGAAAGDAPTGAVRDAPTGAARDAPARAASSPGPARRGRARRDDPQPLSTAIDGLLAAHGWRTAAAVGSVFGRWDQIVGPEVAAHTRPDRFGDGELVVIADSTAWATQVRLLARTLVRRLNEELGDGTVARVIVRGPAPPRQMGPWRVRPAGRPKGDYG